MALGARVGWSGVSLLALALAIPAQAEDGDQDQARAAGSTIVVTGLAQPLLTSEDDTGSRLGLSPLETPATVSVVFVIAALG